MNRKRHQFTYDFFDLSLFLYFVSFMINKDENIPFVGLFRTGATALVLLAGLMLIFKRRGRFRLTKGFRWYALFVAFSTLSALWAYDSDYVFMLAITFARSLAIIFFVSVRIRDEWDLRRVLLLFAFSCFFRIAAIAFLMIQKVSFSGLFSNRFGDIVGYNSNYTAVYCVMALLIMLNETKELSHSWFAFPLLALYGVIVLMTGSKKGILGVLSGVSIYLFFTNRGIKKIKALMIITCLAVVSVYAVMTIPSLYAVLGVRIEQMMDTFQGNVNGNSTIERMLLIEQGIDIWKANPILGVGLVNFTFFQTVYPDTVGHYAHCNYVELLVDLGIIGTAIYYYMPLRICLSRIGSPTMLILKTLTLVILVFDVAAVNYYDLFVIIMFTLASDAGKLQDPWYYYEYGDYS